MACRVVMDLKPTTTKFEFSASKKSATLPSSFAGKYTPPGKRSTKKKDDEHFVEIEIMLTGRSGNRGLKGTVSSAEEIIASGKLLRVTGTLHRMLYQDRNTGEEIDKLVIYAFDVSPSAETEPIFSIVQMEGGVRKVSDAEIFKATKNLKSEEPGRFFRKATFNLFSAPDGSYDRESYLTVYVNGYGDVADWINRLNLKEGSHVMASGKFEATSFGMLCLVLHDLRYANRLKNDEKE